MKVLLLNPPQSQPIKWGGLPPVFLPLGLAYIGAVISQEKIDVSIVDAHAEDFENVVKLKDDYLTGLSKEKIIKIIKKENPDIIGISIQFSINEKIAVDLIDSIKKFNCKIKIIVGGPHPTVRYKEFLEKSKAEYVVIGEGEETIIELLDAIEKKRSLKDVKGIAFKDKNGEIVVTPQRPFIKDLDSLPIPKRELLPNKKYLEANFKGRSPYRYIMHNRYASVITSRGCPFNCSFCSIRLSMGRKFRARSAESVLEELRQLVSVGIKHINFEDDNLTADLERFKKICHMIIDENLNITWSAPNGIRADMIDEESVKLMKMSGCRRVFVAPESGVPRVLEKIVKKNISLKDIEESIKLFKKYKIIVDASFVIGLPGETRKEIEETINYALKLKKIGMNMAGFNIATPLYGTDLYKEVVEKRYLEKDFEVSHLSPSQPLLKTPEWGPEEILNYKKMAELRVNSNAFDLLRRFVYNLKNPKRIISGIKRVVNSYGKF